MSGRDTSRAPAGTLVPTDLAALAAGVPTATIRKWASRGKLKRYGSPGRAEYDLNEIWDLLTEKEHATRAEPGEGSV